MLRPAVVFFVFMTLCSELFAQPPAKSEESQAHAAFEKRDYARSFELFSKLADQGVGFGHYNKGVQLLNGLGVLPDPVRAMESFLSATQLGITKAKTQIGVMYLDGRGVSKNLSLARRWLTEAAGEGDREAHVQLARMYLRGDGIAKDTATARKELLKVTTSAERGQEWVLLTLEAIELWMAGAGLSRAEALTHLMVSDADLQLRHDGDAVDANKQRSKNLEAALEKLSRERDDAEMRAAAALEVARQIKIAPADNSSVKTTSSRERVFQYLEVHALVVGNGTYGGSARLKNPANDAKAISSKFREFGYNVTQLIDVDRKRFVQGLTAFSKTAAKADIVILFYAGHGVQLFGTNYLLPIDVDVDDVAQASLQSISLNLVLEQYLPGKTRVVFLDACRDNPLSRSGTRGVSRGLAPISVAEGTLIAYSTRDGGVAIDGDSEPNSPFVSALLNHIGQNEDIAVILRRVRQTVMSMTNNRQTPWEYGSLTADSLILANIKPIREREN